MSKESEIKKWTKHFAAAGAREPESWARSQVMEGMNYQYARYNFLSGAWAYVIGDGETGWIDQRVQQADKDPDGVGAGCGAALKRLLAAGASREDLAEIVRVMQYETLQGMMELIDSPEIISYPEGTPEAKWALCAIIKDGKDVEVICGLHESVMETDPTGREMCPKRAEPRVSPT
jgi:hypothetical protein